jgi:hypothetical protein
MGRLASRLFTALGADRSRSPYLAKEAVYRLGESKVDYPALAPGGGAMRLGRRALFMGGMAAFAAGGIDRSRRAQAAIRCTAYDRRGIQQCEAGIDSRLGAFEAEQENSRWCWAACISAIFRYNGFWVSQQQIVGETLGRLVNLGALPPQIVSAINRPWLDEGGRRFVSYGSVLWNADASIGGPGATGEASRELAEGHPLILGAAGHAVVLTGLVYDRDAYGRGGPNVAIVRDPWPGRGRRLLSRTEWQQTRFLAKARVSPVPSVY